MGWYLSRFHSRAFHISLSFSAWQFTFVEHIFSFEYIKSAFNKSMCFTNYASLPLRSSIYCCLIIVIMNAIAFVLNLFPFDSFFFLRVNKIMASNQRRKNSVMHWSWAFFETFCLGKQLADFMLYINIIPWDTKIKSLEIAQ